MVPKNNDTGILAWWCMFLSQHGEASEFQASLIYIGKTLPQNNSDDNDDDIVVKKDEL